MARISDVTRSIFAELDKSILDNFTNEEIARIEILAKELKAILTEAIVRDHIPA